MIEYEKEATPKTENELSDCVKRFFECCRDIGWGKLEVRLKGGEPVMVSILRQDIKLD